LTATVPRILAKILNGTIVDGMVVLLHRCRTPRLIACRALTISHATGILAPVYGRFTEGFAIADMRTMRAPLDSLPQRLPQRSFAGDAMRAKFALCPGLLSPTEPGKSGRYMRIYVQDRTIFLNTAGVYKLRERSGAS
jgi:hypothetical protein